MTNKIDIGELDGLRTIIYNQNPYTNGPSIMDSFPSLMGANYMQFQSSDVITPWRSLTGKINNRPDYYDIGLVQDPTYM